MTQIILKLVLTLLSYALAYSVAESYRSMDGIGNHESFGSNSAGVYNTSQVRSLSQADDTDGEMSGQTRPSPRLISNNISYQSYTIPNTKGVSSLFTFFGQFVDHDIVLTPGGNEDDSIDIPTCDRWFDPLCEGSKTMGLTRSKRTNGEISNLQTSYLDLSQVYGSYDDIADDLRSMSGGKLRVDTSTPEWGDMLPFDTDGVMGSVGRSKSSLRYAGDVRANENPVLTSYHTIFMREHNRWCDVLQTANPSWTDEKLYQESRRRNIAAYQNIVTHEYLAILYGGDLHGTYSGYSESTDPNIDVSFSTVAFRYGHSELNSVIERLNENLEPSVGGPVLLRDAFWNPGMILEYGIEELLRGIVYQTQQEVDVHLIDDLRNFLFGLPGGGGFDLLSRNIQRGRDHNVPDYNSLRNQLGLTEADEFDEITSDEQLISDLESVYGDTDDVDAYIGGLAEDHESGAMVGPLFKTIIYQQFERIRKGDRYWFQNDWFDDDELAEIEATKIANIIARNTEWTTASFHTNSLFLVPSSTSSSTPESSKFRAWMSNTYLVTWNVTEDDITIRLHVTTEGWVGIGLNPSSGMTGADIMIFSVHDSTGVVSFDDCIATSKSLPTCTETNHLTDVEGYQSNGETVVTFTRKLITDDSSDHEITNEDIPVIVAWGLTDSIGYHGSNRAKLVLNLVSGEVGGSTSGIGLGKATFDDYSLEWVLGDDDITIEISAITDGWVGIGFQSDDAVGMGGADIVMGMVKNGKGEIRDCYANSNAAPSQDSSLDVSLVSASEIGGVTSIKFTRSLTVNDDKDRKIDRSKFAKIIFSYGSDDSFSSYHKYRGTANINFLTGSSSQIVEVISLAVRRGVHGFIMCESWAILVSVGIMIAMFGREFDWWRVAHIGCMSLACLCALFGFAWIVVLTPVSDFSQEHQMLGLITTIGLSIQVTLGVLSVNFPAKFKIVHRYFGLCLWLVAQVTIQYGIVLSGSYNEFKYAHATWIALWGGLFLSKLLYAKKIDFVRDNDELTKINSPVTDDKRASVFNFEFLKNTVAILSARSNYATPKETPTPMPTPSATDAVTSPTKKKKKKKKAESKVHPE